MIAIQRFRGTARTQCVLVVEHRANFASMSIYRRVKPHVLSKIAATHSLLADLHYVDLSCSRDSPVVRLTGASRWGRTRRLRAFDKLQQKVDSIAIPRPVDEDSADAKPARPVYLSRGHFPSSVARPTERRDNRQYRLAGPLGWSRAELIATNVRN